MKILIIEDKPQHILSAEKFAKECEHEVVIINNYDDASSAIKGKDIGGLAGPVQIELPDIDMVMTDLFMPASKKNLPDELYKTFEGVEQPYGLALALKAIGSGIKKVGILTDGNHHTHPMINTLDLFGAKSMYGNTLFVAIQTFGGRNTPKDWGKLFEKLMST